MGDKYLIKWHEIPAFIYNFTYEITKLPWQFLDTIEKSETLDYKHNLSLVILKRYSFHLCYVATLITSLT